MRSRLEISKNNSGGYSVKVNDKSTNEMGLLVTQIDLTINATDIPRATFHVVFPNGVDVDVDGELEYEEDYEEEQEEG